jgi:prolyl-tRNA editing enzyme YbaK/EbsC (Cys-tRNA(Pro) deacylase)
MKDALAIHRELLARGVPHEIVRLRRIVLTADELPDALGLPPGQCIAVRMYDADGRLVAMCVPAGATPAPSAVLHATGARRIEPTAVDRVNQETQFAAGLVSPLLLPADVPVVFDTTLAAREVLYSPTGESGTAVGIHAADLLSVTGGTVANLLTPTTVDLAADLDVDLSGDLAGDLDRDLRLLAPPEAASGR